MNKSLGIHATNYVMWNTRAKELEEKLREAKARKTEHSDWLIKHFTNQGTDNVEFDSTKVTMFARRSLKIDDEKKLFTSLRNDKLLSNYIVEKIDLPRLQKFALSIDGKIPFNGASIQMSQYLRTKS